MSDECVILDGSFGEGGGQILRTGVGLAAALWCGEGGRELRVTNIRANRPKPGLRAQHLAAVNAAAAVSGGRLAGAEVHSRELTFRAARPQAGQYRFEIGTAGSAMLVLQTVLPALLSAEGDSEIVVAGGTHNPLAPCFEYVRDVFATLAEGAGASVALTLERAGFYPAGGGLVRCVVRGLGDPARLGPLRMTSRGELKYVEGVSGASESLPEHIVRRQGDRAAERLDAAGIRHEMSGIRWPAGGPGTAVFLRAVFQRSVAGFFALGRRGKRAERVADEAVAELVEFLESPGAVDPHAADQLITLLALSPDGSELTTTRITEHLLTNAEVVRRLTGREVIVEGPTDRPGRVIVEAV